jgi:hypothetical protein
MENVYQMIVNHIGYKNTLEVTLKKQEQEVTHKPSYCK